MAVAFVTGVALGFAGGALPIAGRVTVGARALVDEDGAGATGAAGGVGSTDSAASTAAVAVVSATLVAEPAVLDAGTCVDVGEPLGPEPVARSPIHAPTASTDRPSTASTATNGPRLPWMGAGAVAAPVEVATRSRTSVVGSGRAPDAGWDGWLTPSPEALAAGATAGPHAPTAAADTGVFTPIGVVMPAGLGDRAYPPSCPVIAGVAGGAVYDEPVEGTSTSPRTRTASLAVGNRPAGLTAVTRMNQPSNAGGSATPRAAARCVAGSCGPCTAVIAKAMTSPAPVASGRQ